MAINVLGPLAEKKTIGDLIRQEYNPLSGYCRQQFLVYNRSSYAISINDPMGYPVMADAIDTANMKFMAAGQESYLTGLLLRTTSIVSLASGSTIRGLILRRGPVTIDKTIIPTVDYNGSSFTLTTLVTALAAFNPPVLANQEQPNTSTQLT